MRPVRTARSTGGSGSDALASAPVSSWTARMARPKSVPPHSPRARPASGPAVLAAGDDAARDAQQREHEVGGLGGAEQEPAHRAGDHRHHHRPDRPQGGRLLVEA